MERNKEAEPESIWSQDNTDPTLSGTMPREQNAFNYRGPMPRGQSAFKYRVLMPKGQEWPQTLRGTMPVE